MKISPQRILFAWLLSLPILPASAGLLAYYPFDADFTDASGNGNDLTVGAGTPAITAIAGEFASGTGALDLNSTISNQHYLNLTTPISFAANEAWSVSFWVRHRPGNDGRAGMIAGDLTSSDFIWVPRDGVVDGFRFRNSSGQNADYTSPPAGVEPAGVYHHWVVVANGSGSVEVFYDNVSLGSKNLTTTLEITSIGQAFNQNTQSMNGQIDELHIYDEAIDTAKIAELFGEPSGPDTTPPTLLPEGFSDDQSGGPVDTDSAVSYSVSFSEDMDAATVNASDFSNAGTATISIGVIVESSPGVFSVPVTPTTTGTLRLQINAEANLEDAAGNPLDTSSAIADNDTLLVEQGLDPSAVVELKVFLLGGQSNALGRAGPSGLPTSPVNLQQPQDGIDFFEDSLTFLQPRADRFGPEITWGQCLSESLADGVTTRVAIIKYGLGGTDIENDWKSGGDGTTNNDGPRYVTFQNTVSAGLLAFASAYPNATITIEGMLWVQGERDAKGGFENNYATNLTNFIADIRDTYGDHLPFIISRLSIDQTNIPATELAIVRAAQDAVAAADPLSAIIDTDGFGMQGDNFHFDANGLQAIGSAACLQSLNLIPFPTQPDLSTLAGGQLTFTIDQPFAGFQYTLFSNPGLDSENWTALESKTATGDTVTFSVTPPVGPQRQFYRIGRFIP